MSCTKISGSRLQSQPSLPTSATKMRSTSSWRWTLRPSRESSKRKLPTKTLESKPLLASRLMLHSNSFQKAKRAKRMELERRRRDQQQESHCQVNVRSPLPNTTTSSLHALHIQRTRPMRCFLAI